MMIKQYTVVYRKFGEVKTHLINCDTDISEAIGKEGKDLLLSLEADKNSPLFAIVK